MHAQPEGLCYIVLLLLAFTTQLPAAKLVGYTRHGNKLILRLTEGSAELEWASSSTFRLTRSLQPSWASRGSITATAVHYREFDRGPSLRLESEYLAVELDKADMRLRVRNYAGLGMLTEATELVRTEEGIVAQFETPVTEHFFGLGPRPDAPVDARGLEITTRRPFLISSRGYGLSFTTPASYRFDLARTRPDRTSVTALGADRLEYFFSYGPSIKEVFEEHHKVVAFEPPGDEELALLREPPSRATPLPLLPLCQAVSSLTHASLSAMLMPAFNPAAYPRQYARALEFGQVVPIVYHPSPGEAEAGLQAFRRRMMHYLLTYADESRTRGYPMIHPLVMQFPKDLEAAQHTDEFMFGDELLVAPICGESASRSVYLPQGIWTDLRTNQEHKGRQTITWNSPDALPLFARNGSIVPIADGATELHYYPRLGGEFFLYEPSVADYTQVHAGPSADVIRVEIESKVARTYEWVLHHIDGVRGVADPGQERALTRVGDAASLKPGAWWYDAVQKNLHIRVEAAVNSDVIINVSVVK